MESAAKYVSLVPCPEGGAVLVELIFAIKESVYLSGEVDTPSLFEGRQRKRMPHLGISHYKND
jgi:hypothetical protein